MAKRADRVLMVRVIRTGGFAGLRREWIAESDQPAPDDQLFVLVEACPWHEPPRTDPLSRDRFVWRIEVRGDLRRTATLPDAALEGPWRELVQQVQAASEA